VELHGQGGWAFLHGGASESLGITPAQAQQDAAGAATPKINAPTFHQRYQAPHSSPGTKPLGESTVAAGSARLSRTLFFFLSVTVGFCLSSPALIWRGYLLLRGTRRQP